MGHDQSCYPGLGPGGRACKCHNFCWGYVGAPKLSSLLSETNDHRRWEVISEAAASRDIALPQLNHGHARAEAKVRKAAQRQKVLHQRMRAADLQPIPGFFVNADGTLRLPRVPAASTSWTLSKLQSSLRHSRKFSLMS